MNAHDIIHASKNANAHQHGIHRADDHCITVLAYLLSSPLPVDIVLCRCVEYGPVGTRVRADGDAPARGPCTRRRFIRRGCSNGGQQKRQAIMDEDREDHSVSCSSHTPGLVRARHCHCNPFVRALYGCHRRNVLLQPRSHSPVSVLCAIILGIPHPRQASCTLRSSGVWPSKLRHGNLRFNTAARARQHT